MRGRPLYVCSLVRRHRPIAEALRRQCNIAADFNRRLAQRIHSMPSSIVQACHAGDGMKSGSEVYKTPNQALASCYTVLKHA